MTLDAETLQHWRALTEAATEGPWSVVPNDPNGENLHGPDCYADHDGYIEFEPNDAAFIAEARAAMPRLLDEIERLRAEATERDRLTSAALSLIIQLDEERPMYDRTERRLADLRDALRASTIKAEPHADKAKETML